jgi:hypothetical protein
MWLFSLSFFSVTPPPLISRRYSWTFWAKKEKFLNITDNSRKQEVGFGRD